MREDLLPYYERELKFIRQSAGEFAEKYPKVAGRLKLRADSCDDPHVERLIEAFAVFTISWTTNSPKSPSRSSMCCIPTI
jgi:type VI secretion system protein ImpG